MLEKLSSRHNEWVLIVLGFGINKFVAEDIVQEAYIRIDRLIKNKDKIIDPTGSVHTAYMWTVLRNLCFDYKRKKNRYTLFEYRDFDNPSSLNMDNEFLYDDEAGNEAMLKEEKLDDVFNSIMDSINELDSNYDSKLATIYFRDGLSLRKIAENTDIGVSSIYNSVKNIKKILIEKHREDIEDFYNRDYDLI